MSADNCPSCGTSLIGEPIPEKYLQHASDHDDQIARMGRCYCKPYGDVTHFRRVIGVEVPGVYDGVLFWKCPDCGHGWPRDFGDWARLNGRSVEYAQMNNQSGGESS